MHKQPEKFENDSTKSGLTAYSAGMRLSFVIRWLATALAICVLTPFVEPVVQRSLEQRGYYALADHWVVAILNWVVSIFGSVAAPYVTGGAVGVAGGIWLHSAATRFDRRRERRPTSLSSPDHSQARRLTFEQQEKLASIVRQIGIPGGAMAVYISGMSQECADFADDIASSFRMADIMSKAERDVYSDGITSRGVELVAPRKEGWLERLSAGLKDIGIDHAFRTQSESTQPYINVGRGPYLHRSASSS